MYVALRDLRFARGRFVLIGSVVALITVLVGFLAGLTGGLADHSISALVSLPGDRVVFSELSVGSEVSFADSAITKQQAEQWSATDQVSKVQPIGISQTRAEAGDLRIGIALFGVEPATPSERLAGIPGTATPRWFK